MREQNFKISEKNYLKTNLFIREHRLVIRRRIRIRLGLRIHARLLLTQLHQFCILLLDLRLVLCLFANARVPRCPHAIDDGLDICHGDARVANLLRQLFDFRAQAFKFNRHRLILSFELQQTILFLLSFVLHFLELLVLPFDLSLLFEFPENRRRRKM